MLEDAKAEATQEDGGASAGLVEPEGNWIALSQLQALEASGSVVGGLKAGESLLVLLPPGPPPDLAASSVAAADANAGAGAPGAPLHGGALAVAPGELWPWVPPFQLLLRAADESLRRIGQEWSDRLGSCGQNVELWDPWAAHRKARRASIEKKLQEDAELADAQITQAMQAEAEALMAKAALVRGPLASCTYLSPCDRVPRAYMHTVHCMALIGHHPASTPCSCPAPL